jgi:exodeoxyribonuclease VII small subunit
MSENEAATFEAKLTRLEDIVKVLESPQVTLEASVKLFREGKDLAGECEQLLKEAEGLVNDTGEVDE